MKVIVVFLFIHPPPKYLSPSLSLPIGRKQQVQTMGAGEKSRVIYSTTPSSNDGAPPVPVIDKLPFVLFYSHTSHMSYLLNGPFVVGRASITPM